MAQWRCILILTIIIEMTAASAGQSPSSVDWPQWRGPARDGVSKESGLMKQWPADGPPRVWLASGLGAGYGSVAIQGDRIFLQSLVSRQSVVISVNRADGKLVWSRVVGPGSDNDQGPGP